MSGRILLSPVLAASLLAADLVLLTLFLNPGLDLRHEASALLRDLFLPYLVVGTAAFLLAGLLGTALRWWPRAPRPPVEGLPWFASLTLLALALAAGLYWLNLLSYRHSIPVESVRALAAASLALSGAVLVVVAVGLDTLLFPLGDRGVSAPLLVLAAASGVVMPLALQPRPAPAPRPVPLRTETVQPARRVILVGCDGLGPADVLEGAARGTLPAFSRILTRGAHGPLATLRPTEAPPVWTTIVTGRLPRDHGIKSFSSYRLAGSTTSYELLPKGALVGLLERLDLVTTAPVTSASRRCRALWNALNAFGIPSGVVRLWGTHPPERVKGFMLSDYFHLLQHDPRRVGEALFPRDLVTEVVARGVDAGEIDRGLMAQFVDFSVEDRGAVPWRRELLERALAPDLSYDRAGAALRAAYDPPFFTTYFYGLDVLGHTFLRFERPEQFGDVDAAEARRYGHVVARYRGWISQRVGELERGLRPGEILIVVSGYGMEPLPLWRRLLRGSAGQASGTHAGAPDGVLMAVGDGIRPGAVIDSASLLDLTPTILYLMGLPVARDMEGRVLGDMIDDDFARAHPVTFIPSYESLAVTPAAAPIGPDLPPLPE